MKDNVVDLIKYIVGGIGMLLFCGMLMWCYIEEKNIKAKTHDPCPCKCEKEQATPEERAVP